MGLGLGFRRRSGCVIELSNSNPKGCKESSRWSESAETTGSARLIVHILASPEASALHCGDLKKESSTWAKENFNRRLTWQEGYAAFTVSPTATDSVRRYLPRRRRIIVNIPLLMN